MTERSSVTQVVQIGVESSIGTPVDANKKLQSISIKPRINAETRMFRPGGNKFPTVQALNREWSTAPFEGQPTYDELAYLLSSVLCTANITTPGGGSTSRQWAFGPSSTGEDPFKSFTIEQGSSVRAHESAGNFVNDFTLTFGRTSDVAVSGSFMGQALSDNISLTAAPTAIPLIPLLPSQATIYLDTSSGALGTTKLTRNFSCEFSIADRRTALWVTDASKSSWVDAVEKAPNAKVKLKVAADSQGMGLLPVMRAGDTRFMRIEFVGPIIEGAIPYKLNIDCALKVSDVADFSDDQDVMTIEWTLDLVHDSSWGKAITALLVNTLTAL